MSMAPRFSGVRVVSHHRTPLVDSIEEEKDAGVPGCSHPHSEPEDPTCDPNSGHSKEQQWVLRTGSPEFVSVPLLSASLVGEQWNASESVPGTVDRETEASALGVPAAPEASPAPDQRSTDARRLRFAHSASQNDSLLVELPQHTPGSSSAPTGALTPSSAAGKPDGTAAERSRSFEELSPSELVAPSRVSEEQRGTFKNHGGRETGSSSGLQLRDSRALKEFGEAEGREPVGDPRSLIPANSKLDDFGDLSDSCDKVKEERSGRPRPEDEDGTGQVSVRSDSVSDAISSIQQLGSVRCVKQPLGSFEETLTYMKFREYVRRHHGVFGTTTASACIWWILGCQFLVITVALMTCHTDPESNTHRRSFVDLNKTVGRVCVYFFCSLALTAILALKFAGPLMLMWSVRLSKLACAVLLILAPSIQIRESARGDAICTTVLYVDSLQLNGMVLFNGIFTQLQLLMFICSMFNCLFWGRLHAYWFQNHSVKLWNIVKKQKVQLQIPQPIEKALNTHHHSERDLADGRVINADGEYIEVHGFSFMDWLRRLLTWAVPSRFLPASLKPSVSVVFYVGQVDSRGLPHGFGRWRSEAYHGESIVGYWDHGIPVGPFKSREFGTGSGFMCIRIGWCKVTKGPLRPEMQLGIGDAECCVSGAFFRTFPRVTLYPLRAKEQSELGSVWYRHGLDEAVANDNKGAAVARLSNFSYTHESRALGVPSAPQHTRSLESVGNDNLPSRSYGELGRGSDDIIADIGGRLQRMRGSVIQRAHLFFKRRSEGFDSDTREAFFKECQRLCLSRMVPHLPNFGLLFTTELHITVDPERGLYIAGWVPVSAVLPLGTVEAAKPRLLPQHAASDSDNAGNPRDDELLSDIRGPRDKQKTRQMSESQLRARGFHQRFGLALHGPEMMIKRKAGKGGLRNTVVGDFFYERPRIRRQTYDGESKRLVVRIRNNANRKTQNARGSGSKPLSNTPSTPSIMAKTLKHGVSFSPNDPLAPDDDPMKGFNWMTSAPELHIDGWRRAEVAGIPEALIFIHGYNTNHVQSLQIMAQMLSFGNFPSYIKPFLFTWPAGRNFTEFFEARENANNPKIQQCFHEFIVSLRDNGIRQIHIMAHSLGSRLLMNSLRGMAEFTFSKSLDTENDGKLPTQFQDRMQLVSLIFLNPEFFLDDFVLREYSFLRQYCSNISLFCDAHDGALWWSELFSGRQALGRSVFGLYTRPREDESASDVPPKLPPVFAETMACFQGYEPDYLKSDTRDWLDLDVIDMTWLGHNVHSMRHSYWPLNREIIEDIRELVVTRKRARQRTSRLDRREGNVWVYRVAPSSLTSIFDSDI
ncbi:hypothetical protein TGGT1_289880 [Toxoplasma gondii GT1]|uniref:Transmembrane protein n=15 Tax=Toxoplasma gondii TaxID=5811 RepID=A0A125YP60_TOXGV|nr:hypothetical protein TGGT1_289880 [Toxoplasma gondii GT1]ESS33879.1 putative transmembrane protein [Toxoplasma gondii VEG]KAF4644470.1 hypothetical protein TGRH88_014640 [Toxoplasma gondii]KFH09057.1 putative transmembrane protein [Toxoplasma gondii VAND]